MRNNENAGKMLIYIGSLVLVVFIIPIYLYLRFFRFSKDAVRVGEFGTSAAGIPLILALYAIPVFLFYLYTESSNVLIFGGVFLTYMGFVLSVIVASRLCGVVIDQQKIYVPYFHLSRQASDYLALIVPRAYRVIDYDEIEKVTVLHDNCVVLHGSFGSRAISFTNTIKAEFLLFVLEDQGFQITRQWSSGLIPAT